MALAESKLRVHAAAVELFATKGFHGTGIREIAEVAQLSSASLYHYMGTKEELLVGVMRECLENLISAAYTATDGMTDARARVSTLAALHVLTHAQQPNETQVVDGELRALSTSARELITPLRDAYERLWSDAIDSGIRHGYFCPDEPSVTRLALLEMCSGVARWYSPRGPLALPDLARHYARTALRALGCANTGNEPDLDQCMTTVATIWAA